MSMQEFEIQFDIKSNNYVVNSERVIKEIKPNYEQITIIPSTETQIKEGSFDKVTVEGNDNLVPENIAEGKTIFGVEGNAKITSAKITSGYYLFYSNNRIDYVQEIINLCEGIDSCYYMFNGCNNLQELDLSNLDTSNVKTMNYMFNGCSKLININLSNLNTSNVTDMNNMFSNCTSLQEVNLSSFNTSNVTTMISLFSQCSNLTNVNLSSFDTSNVTDMSDMFRRCNKLEELDLSSFDMSKVNNIYTILLYIYDLPILKSFKNLGKGYTENTTNYGKYKLDLSNMRALNKESLIDIITNGLYDLNLTYDVANGGTLYSQQITLNSTSKSKLTAEEIAIATNKGWTVA